MEQISTDHDLLITLHEQVRGIRDDIKDIKDNLNSRVTKLEDGRVDRKELEALKNDVRWLQRIAYTSIGIMGAIQFYFNAIR